MLPCGLSPSRLLRPSILEARPALLIPLLGILTVLTGSISVAAENIVIQPSGTDEPSIELRFPGASPGAVMSYASEVGSNAVVFQVPTSADRWQWQYVDANGDHLRMELKADSSLELLNNSGTPTIVLNPGTGAGLPGITIGNSPVLTQSVADTRYLSSAPGVMLINGNGAVQIGTGAQVTVPNVVAIGPNALVSGSNSIALGSNATVSKWESAALGHSSTASGPTSLALGAYSTATQHNAVAVGVGAQATGLMSFASGWATIAQGYGQVVLGALNEAKGNPNVADDPQSEILILGSGFQKVDGQGVLQTTRQNALTVKRNGDAEISGSLKVNGVIRVEQAGDISMGMFTAEPIQP